MAVLAGDEVSDGDAAMYLLMLIIYVTLVWVPGIICVFLVYTHPYENFRKTWMAWTKQKIYIEVWFRTHMIVLLIAVIVVIFEPG